MCPWRNCNEHLLSDRLEVSTEVAGALEHQYFLLRWFHSDVFENILIEGLHTMAGDYDINAANGK